MGQLMSCLVSLRETKLLTAAELDALLDRIQTLNEQQGYTTAERKEYKRLVKKLVSQPCSPAEGFDIVCPERHKKPSYYKPSGWK